MRRVVVTGMGAITPLGLNVEEFWNGLKEGRHGFGEITKFDTSDYKVHLAAEVKGFQGKDYMDFKAAKRMELFCQYAVAAAKEALEQSGIDMEQEDPFMVGCSIGSGIGSLQTVEREHKKLMEKGPSRVNPLMVPLMISNMAAGNVSIQFGLKGKSINVVTACASGTHCIGEAYRTIQFGDADVMVAGGAESCITPVGVAGFSALTALSNSTDPDRCSIPFDKERDGFVMGEGAGIVVLEELEHAKKRGATILAEVVGYGATSDAYHITSPIEDGSGAARCMENAVKEAGIALDDVMYINAHGTSTHHNDLFETRAIKKVFGDHAKEMKINSTKSMIGHLLGAAGAAKNPMTPVPRDSIICIVAPLIGTGDIDAASSQKQRSFGFLEHFQSFLQLPDVNAGVGFITADINAFWVFGTAHLAHNVFGKVNEHRTGSACAGNVECFFDNTSQILTPSYRNAVFGDASGDSHDIDFLESVVSDQVSRYLPGEAYQGNTVVVGSCQSCYQIAGAGTAGYQADTHFPCGPGIGVCLMYQSLLVAGKDNVNAALFVKLIADINGTGSRISEENFYALFL